MLQRKFIVLSLVVFFLLLLGGGGLYTFGIHKENTGVTATVQEVTATLEIFTPEVFVEDASGKKNPAVDKQTVTEGMTVSTGESGRAQLVYTGGTVTRVDHNSSFLLENLEENTIQVQLEEGRVWSRIKKLSGKETYQTETSTVIATVRGTSFGHGILPDGRNRVLSSKRSVAVTCLNDTQEGQVTSRTQFFLDCQNGSESTIIPLSDEEFNDEWYQFNIQQDQILNRRFGAKTYDDEGEVLEEQDTPTPSLSPTRKPTSTPTTQLLLTPTQQVRLTLTPTQQIKPTLTPTSRFTPTAIPPSPTVQSPNDKPTLTPFQFPGQRLPIKQPILPPYTPTPVPFLF